MAEQVSNIPQDSQESVNVANSDVKTEVVSATEVEINFENYWNNEEKLKIVTQKMEKLSKVRFNIKTYPEDVKLTALAEVIPNYFNGYDSFKDAIHTLIVTKRNEMPKFVTKTKDKQTGRYDFWIIRNYVSKSGEYVAEDGTTYSKKELLESDEFREFLFSFCKHVLKSEVFVCIYSSTLTGKQHLDTAKILEEDKAELQRIHKSPNYEDFILFQFRKNTFDAPAAKIDISEFPVLPKKNKDRKAGAKSIVKIKKEAEIKVMEGIDY
jgi:hypothetical protein